jgi:5-methylcytosine-specific restriction endonuclease McrA
MFNRKKYMKEYNRQYRLDNMEKIKECNKKYYQNNREIILKYVKEYQKENKEKVLKYKKQYRINNKEKIAENLKQYYFDNREAILKSEKQDYPKNIKRIAKYNGQYYLKNKDKIIKCTKQYYQENREKVRENKKYYERNRRKKDIKYNLNGKVGMMIRYSLKGNKNRRHWETLVGYTLNDLMKRLKKTMPEGYAWQDYLDGKLHIDHIIPISVFNFDKPEHIDFKRCWALENLRLLSAKENNYKRAKLYKPFQLSLCI